MNFLKNILSSAIGFIIGFLIILFFIIGITSTIASIDDFDSQYQKPIEKESILNLDLNKIIIENPPKIYGLEQALGLSDDIVDFNTILNSIKVAKDDDLIIGINLKSGFPLMGWAQIKTLRDELLDFKKNGKFIYSYSDLYTQKGYYLSSVSDSIFLHELGLIEFKGLASEVLYYKDFQDKYGFKMEIVRSGKYKSAVEPFLENKMSKNNQDQIKELLDDFWEIISNDISISRSISLSKIDSIANELSASNTQIAIKDGILDGTLYENEYEDFLKNKLDLDSLDKIDFVNPQRLMRYNNLRKKGVRDLVAVIYVQGNIVYGAEGLDSSISHKTFIESIDKSVNDPRVKSIVLRINSPGGNAISSDIMWNAIENAKLKKPVVVSMGNIAASGGYYVAANADKIYVNPLTLTGSIGVFAMLPNISKFSKSIGVNSQKVQTHSNSLGYSIYEKITPGYKSSVLSSVEKIYYTFKEKVSDGRNISMINVEKIAQGRVWSASSAIEKKLADDFGNLSDAISHAAKLSNIDEYNLIYYPEFKPDIENLFSIGISLFNDKLDKKTKLFFDHFLNNQQKISLRTEIPFHIEIK